MQIDKTMIVLTAWLGVACQPVSDPAATGKLEDPKTVEQANLTTQPLQGNKGAAFIRVTDPSTVCMVTDRYMGSPQIPVQVAGKTYFGCCKMCEKRLRDEPAVRSATDPVSKAQVDKAVAVLARDNDGNVFYFANEQSFSSAGARL